MKEKNISDSLGEAIESYYTNKLTQSQAEELLEWLGKGLACLKPAKYQGYRC
jgi:hypothetical protein